MFSRYLYIETILWNFIQNILGLLCVSNQNHTLVMGNVGCLVYLTANHVGCLGGPVMKVDFAGAVKTKMVTSGYVMQVIFEGYLCVSGPCVLQLSCGNIPKIA